MKKSEEVMPILLAEWLIESERVPQLRRGAGRRAFAKHLFDGIAGDHVDHQENQGKHQPQCGQRKQKTLEEVTKHRKGNYDRETAELAGFPEGVSESLLFVAAGGLMRSIFTRATRLPSISAMVKRRFS